MPWFPKPAFNLSFDVIFTLQSLFLLFLDTTFVPLQTSLGDQLGNGRLGAGGDRSCAVRVAVAGGAFPAARKKQSGGVR
ncbi:hypothetical protein M5689_009196 [Euphorbia peplus]|nr:hypothetical protein M5689_009196 [Euphorbia peplus]